jgi:hypothetical protein
VAGLDLIGVVRRLDRVARKGDGHTDLDLLRHVPPLSRQHVAAQEPIAVERPTGRGGLDKQAGQRSLGGAAGNRLRGDVEGDVHIGQAAGQLVDPVEAGADLDALVRPRGVRFGIHTGRHIFGRRDEVSTGGAVASELTQGVAVDGLDGADLTAAVFLDLYGNVCPETAGRHHREEGDQQKQTTHRSRVPVDEDHCPGSCPP